MTPIQRVQLKLAKTSYSSPETNNGCANEGDRARNARMMVVLILEILQSRAVPWTMQHGVGGRVACERPPMLLLLARKDV